ncbi:MAG: hypothetical protein AB2551_12550 [Candidatus Thiodiazotropha sp.]
MLSSDIEDKIKIIIALLGVIGGMSIIVDNPLLLGFTALSVYGIHNRRKFGLWISIGVFAYTAVSGSFILFLFFDVASANANYVNWLVKMFSLLAVLASLTALTLFASREVRDVFH